MYVPRLTQNLVKGRKVRIRIVGTRVDANEIVRTVTNAVCHWDDEGGLPGTF
mgnify:FL=1